MEFMNTSFLIIYAILAVIWFIALNFLTFQKGTESVAVSRRLAGVIKRAIGISGVDFCADEGDIDKRLRFLAHPIGFGVLAALSINAVRAMCAVVAGENADGVSRKGLVVAIAFLVFWSIASEVMKKCIPGRHCNEIDIIGNLIGVGMGSVGSLLTLMA